MNYQSLRARNMRPSFLGTLAALAMAMLSHPGGVAADEPRPQAGTADRFGMVEASGLRWLHLSSRHGDLPVPSTSRQQTAALVADLDKDGRNDIVLGFRQTGPALVWYRRTATGWDRYVIEKDFLTIEAGGAVCDIDGDGKGNFRKTVFQTGMGFHEARLADLDGDGRLDILSKPHTWDTPRLDVWLNRGPAGK
jgi:hypothetical protein